MLRCARRKHDNGPRFELPPGGASDVEEDAGGASLSLSSVGWPLGSPLVGLAEAARIEAIISDTEGPMHSSQGDKHAAGAMAKGVPG